MKTIALVRFFPKAKMGQEEYKLSLKRLMPMFEAANGLNRKYFCATDTGSAGIYEWRSQDEAEAFYNDDWLQRMQQVATNISIEYMPVRAGLDNEAGRTEFYI
jgi:hypothetical protein